jgi:hypothetical protein
MRQIPPPLTDESLAYDTRLDALQETQQRRGRGWRILGWLGGGILAVPVMLGFLTLLPAQPVPPPAAPVPQQGAASAPPPRDARPRETPAPQGMRGYKDFAWGDSIVSVKSRVPDLKDTSSSDIGNAMAVAFRVQYGRLYDMRMPSPLTRVGGNVVAFHSQTTDMSFAFLQGKLFAVAVHFQDENPLTNLEKKYGSATPIAWTMVINGWKWISRVWFESKDRIIIHDHNEEERWDIVTYLDSAVYTPAAAQFVQERTNEAQKLFKRLD